MDAKLSSLGLDIPGGVSVGTVAGSEKKCPRGRFAFQVPSAEYICRYLLGKLGASVGPPLVSASPSSARTLPPQRFDIASYQVAT